MIISILVALLLKWHYLDLLRVDSDEPQHLHVVWLWTQGLLPFRDAFDNHMPLFAFVMAPLLRWIGERPDAVLLMRIPMLLLWFASLWPVARIAAATQVPRVLPIAMLLVTLDTVLFAYSQQFRPDNLWALFWLLAMARLANAEQRRGAATRAGFLAGAALATSMKTSVLLASLAAAAAVLVLVERRRVPWSALLRFALASMMVPALVVIACWQGGLLADFYRCVIGDNLGSGLHQQTQVMRWVLALLLFPLSLFLLRKAFRSRERETLPVRIVLLGGLWALIVFRVLWPSFTDQDELPTLPLVLILLSVAIERASARWSERRRLGLFATIALALLLLLQVRHPFFEDAAADDTARRRQVLALTGPADAVLDAKGETVFRRRPVYQVFELLTLHKIRRGEIRLDLPQVLRERGVGVVLPSRVITDREFADFLAANYLQVAPGLLLAGKRFDLAEGQGGIDFDLAIAGDYRADGCESGCRIDGATWSGTRPLPAGRHRLEVDGARRVDLLLASVARLPSYHAAPPQLEAPLCTTP